MYVSSKSRRRRPGGVILEFSLALPILFFLTLGTCVLSLGVSQFQIVANVAREGARYASVHGSSYAQATGKAAATASDVYNNGIVPYYSGMVSPNLTYSVAWSPNNQPGSTVSVTVSYNWVPSAYLGTVNMSSTSVKTITY